MKCVILTAAYQRWDTVKVFAAGIKRLKAANICDIEVMMVGSEGPYSARFAKDNGFHYMEFDNDPLGAKWNAGLMACEKLNPDFVLALGSDDVVSNSYLEYACNAIKDGTEYIASLDCYFYHSPTARSLFWDGYQGNRRGEPIGAGKVFSKSLLKKVDYKIWDGTRSHSLDHSCEQHLKAVNHKRTRVRCKPYNMMVLDIKDGQGITKFRQFENSRFIDNSEIFQFLSEKELSLLRIATP